MIAIYKIRNVVNGKFYVGSSVNTKVRFQNHRRHLRRGTHHCGPLQNAWAKHGEDAFKFEIVEQVNDAADLLEIENRWLAEHHGKIYCYNISRFADAPTRGMKFSEEHRAKIGKSLAGKSVPKSFRSPEHAEKIRQNKLGNTNFLGRTHADKAKSAISLAHAGKKHRLGHTNSQEHRSKISAANKGKKRTPEQVAVRYRAIIEITTGAIFESIKAASEYYGIEKGNLVRAIKNDAPLKRGPNAGLHFRYALLPATD